MYVLYKNHIKSILLIDQSLLPPHATTLCHLRLFDWRQRNSILFYILIKHHTKNNDVEKTYDRKQGKINSTWYFADSFTVTLKPNESGHIHV